MIERRIVRMSRGACAGLGAVGVFWGGFAGLMPDIKAAAGASDAAFGLIMMLSAAGSMCTMALAPRFVTGLGRASLPVAGIFLSLAFLLLAMAGDLVLLSFGVFVLGACVGLMDISSNIRVATIEASEGVSLMNFAHAMFSFAFGLTALGVGWARQAGFGPTEILPALCLLSLVLVIATIEPATGWHAPEETPEGQGGRLPRNARVVALLAAIILFSSFVGENSTEAWSALHIERTLGAEVGHGSYGPAVLGLVMGLARLAGQAVTARIGERTLIIVSAAMGAVGALVIAGAVSPGMVLWGVGIVAAGLATVVPSANTVLGRRVPGHLRSRALSRAWMLGMTGFFIGPSVMGLVAEGFGLRVSYVVIAVIIAVTIPAVLAVGRIPVIPRRGATGGQGAEGEKSTQGI